MTKLGKPENKVNGVVRRDCTFLDLLKTILICTIVLHKEYIEKFFATCLMHIVKDMMGPDTSTRMSAKS